MSDELKTLQPGTEVVVLGETILIKPFFFGQQAKVAKLLGQLGPVAFKAFTGGKMDFISLLSEGGEAVYELLMLASGKPRAWFDRIGTDEGLDLIAAVIEENKEEFTKKVTPKLEKLALAMGVKTAEKPAEAGEPSTQN